jgi:sodium transport system ATP-binding protein
MIEVENLTKVFADKKNGEKRAVEGVSFAVQPGEIFGLLGPNGAGKTTTTRILATILAPSAGTARIAGHDIVQHPQKVRAQIGYLTGGAGLYERLTARELLRYFGALYGMSRDYCDARILSVSDELEMTEFLDRKCEKLSTGQKQRVSIARAVLHEPPVLFFDEPTSGLDVLAARTVVNFIRRCRSEGKTVLFSTHIMSEVETLCDRIGIIYNGHLAGIGTLAELRAQTQAEAFESVFLRVIGLEQSEGEAS